ncbi:MAG TPA: glycosyltransferase family 4 protein [Silvibacterium sp.]|nr:glycosyltransferase family 4 protein [Silvibacterium sp.]
MPPKLRVALINRQDTNDVGVLSGYPYFMARALERQSVCITPIGPVDSTWMKIGRYLSRTSSHLIKRRYDWTHSIVGSRELGGWFSKRLSRSEYDVIFAPVASSEIAYLKTSVPIVYLTDMTFRAASSYYASFSNLLPFTAAEGNLIEKRAIRNAAKIVVPSDWTAQSLREDYLCEPDKVEVVSFGANLDDPPSRDEALRHHNLNCCKLLLLGVNWDRKGGPLALEILKSLLKRGLKAELLVCGCTPPPGISHSSMHVLPFLNKNKPDEARQLRQLLLTSTFLLVPSLAEAWGLVFCEASACGLPSITRATGGIPSVVRNGINGLCLSPGAAAEQYSDQIIDLFQNPAQYRSLQLSSRSEYEQRLNWNVWASRMVEIFDSIKTSNPTLRRTPRPSNARGDFSSLAPDCDTMKADPNGKPRDHRTARQ